MKEIRYLLIGLFLASLLAGCEKEPVIVTDHTLKVTLSAIPQKCEVGENVTVSWTSNAQLVTMNEKNVSPSGMKIIERLERDTTLIFKFYINGTNQPVLDSVKIIVNQPPPPTDEEIREKLLSLAPWSNTKLEFLFEPNGEWKLGKIWESMKDDLITFHLIPSQRWVYDNGVNRNSDELRTTSGDWYLNDHIINFGSEGSNKKITTLTQNELIWIYESPDTSGKMVWVRETFVHPK